MDLICSDLLLRLKLRDLLAELISCDAPNPKAHIQRFILGTQFNDLPLQLISKDLSLKFISKDLSLEIKLNDLSLEVVSNDLSLELLSNDLSLRLIFKDLTLVLIFNDLSKRGRPPT